MNTGGTYTAGQSIMVDVSHEEGVTDWQLCTVYAVGGFLGAHHIEVTLPNGVVTAVHTTRIW